MRSTRRASSRDHRAARPSNGSPPSSSPRDPRELARLIEQEEEELRQGGGPAGQQRQMQLGRLTARQRVARLIDAKTHLLELNLWAGWKMYPQVGDVPAAGVITGIGSIRGRSCMIVANDATVKAGAFFPATCKKVLRAQKIASLCSLPLVYLVDSAGVFLPMQDEIFPDEDDFGRIFRNNAVISAMGIPQIAAVMGNCVAGGAYLPVLCDKLLMTAGSEMYLAGPALVKAAIGQEVDPADLGGAKMHAQVSGTADFHEPDDPSCLKRVRELVAMLPEEPAADRHGSRHRPGDIYEIISPHRRGEYDTRDLLNCIVDADSLIEYKSDYGKTLICAYASIGGHKAGIVANQRMRCRSARGEIQIGGVIYDDSSDKAARFIMDCNQSRLPLVFFQDVLGFMVGRDSEQHGIIRSGAKLVNVVSNSTVPKITVVIGGSFGAGNYALCGKAFDPVFIFAWPGARYAVMGAEQAADTLMALEQRQRERAGGRSARGDLDELRQTVKASYEAQTDIRHGAARGWIDAIVAPHATRDVLIRALALATRPASAGGMRAGVLQV